jgi:acylphosphatase
VVDVEAIIRRHVWVEGRVQGVWFRESCRRLATQLGIAGWVCNRPDGRVEAVFEGTAPEVHQTVEWCREGPSRAAVTSLKVVDESPLGEKGFSVR